MKKKINTIFLLLLTAVFANAQPVAHPEQYGNTSLIHYIFTSNTAAGAPGANQRWDFSMLAPLGTSNDTLTEMVDIANGTTVYPFSNTIQRERFSDSTIRFFGHNGADYGIIAFADSTSGPTLIQFGHPVLNAFGAMTYGTNASDTFTETIDVGSTFMGKGATTLIADAYGTLVLPDSTYTNVTRLKTLKYDTINPGGPPITIMEVSYRWYDQVHASPLLTIDTTISNFGTLDTTIATRYMLDEHTATAVPGLSKESIDFNGHLSGAALTISAAFAKDQSYDLALLTIAGKKVFGRSFKTEASKISFDLDSDIPCGTYILCLTKSGQQTWSVRKVTKI